MINVGQPSTAGGTLAHHRSRAPAARRRRRAPSAERQDRIGQRPGRAALWQKPRLLRSGHLRERSVTIMAELVVRKPLPAITTEAKPFWDAAAQQKLLIQRCQDCSAWVWTPRPSCNECGSEKIEWTPMSGKGEIYSFHGHSASRRPCRFQILRAGYPLRHRLGRSRRRARA